MKRLASGLVVVVLLTMACYPALSQEFAEGIVDVSKVSHERGYCYTVRIEAPCKPDGYYGPVSRLRLFEDDSKLGPAHSGHEAIRGVGEGRFSHWGSKTGDTQTLYFSASDNSDPRTNGRTYKWVVRIAAGLGEPESVRLATLPDSPFERDLNTVLLAHLDSDQSSDADYARTYAPATGTPGDPSSQGRFGLGMTPADTGLVYAGLDNLYNVRGTVEFWVKSLPDTNVWADDQDHTLFSAYGHRGGYAKRITQNIIVQKKGEDKLLHFTIQWPEAEFDDYEFDLGLPVADLAPDEWHHVLISWDNHKPGQMWLLVDGEGQHLIWDRDSNALGFAPATSLQFGGPGVTVDEIRVLDEPVAARIEGAELPARPELDIAQLFAMQTVVREWLDYTLAVQQDGNWPSVLPYPKPPVTRYSLVNSDASRSVGRPLLDAYRLWEDERYLRAACALGDFYIRAMFPEGGWTQSYAIGLDGSVYTSSRIANFEEWVQSNAIRHLAALYEITGIERFRDAALKGGEVILWAQGEEGWWPWGAAIGPETRAEYMRGPTLNDWNLNCCMEDCLVLYKMTGDERFLDAIFQAGEWLISAQLDQPTPGWAAQYDMNGEPCWARRMEPPAADNVFGTYGAGRGLLMLYDITGEERYIEPLRVCLEWLQSIPEEQKGWMWYAHRDWAPEENMGSWGGAEDYAVRYGTTAPSEEARKGIAVKAGEPVVAYYYQICPVTHAELDSYLIPLNAHYGSRSENAENWLAAELEKRANGPIIPATKGPVPQAEIERARLTPEDAAAMYNPSSVAGILTQFQNWQAGKPSRGGILYDDATSGRCVAIYRGAGRAVAMLRQIALAYIALGKLPAEAYPVYATDYAYVDPDCNWYDLPLAE